MAKHLASTQAHSLRTLAPPDVAAKDRAELLSIYRKFLKIEEHRIRLRHHAGAGGLVVARQRAELLDRVLENLFTRALAMSDPGRSPDQPPPVTIVATGGYGRQLLNPCSDVDLLFLHPTSAAPNEEARLIIEEMLYMLWDVGFKVGHAVRSVKESVNQANRDPKTKSSLIESRLVAGDQRLYDEFWRQFLKHCVEGHEREYLELRLADMKERRAKYRTVFLQEPHVKNGCGGLRDYHTLLWVTFLEFGGRDLNTLVEKRVFDERALGDVDRAYDFLHRVRTELHYQTGRPNDILTLRLQGVIARNFGYVRGNMLRGVEAFMRDYYQHTHRLFRNTTTVLDRLHLAHEEERQGGIVSFLARRQKKREEFGAFYSWNGRIYPLRDDIFEEAPRRIMRVFQHMQQRQLRLSPEMDALLSSHYHLINKEFRYNKDNRTIFEAILSRRGDVAWVLREMHRGGILGRYLPEFGALDCLVQHEFFHRYTADHHTLMCMQVLDDLVDATDPKLAFFRDLYHAVENPYILYLAFIMHDTGRAENVRIHTDASTYMADRVCRRLQITGERRRLLLFLVDHHLTFWRTATTRCIDDPQVVADFAHIMRDKRHLDLLYLFTYADSKGTSEDSWTDWKGMLMQQLYRATLLYWQDNAALSTPDEKLRPSVAKLLGEDFADDVRAHFESLPARYFLFREPETIGRHIRLARQYREAAAADENAVPVFEWVDHLEANYSEFIVCSRDRHLLLARIAGILASQEINILGADFYCRTDDLVLDIFRVCTTNFEAVTNGAMRRRVSEAMSEAFSREDFDFSPMIAKARKKTPVSPEATWFPQRVSIDNHSSEEATLIELQALDRIGLLYDCFAAIGRMGLEVTHSRIMTEKGAAIDTIYVTTEAGKKVEDEATARLLRERLEAVLEV